MIESLKTNMLRLKTKFWVEEENDEAEIGQTQEETKGKEKETDTGNVSIVEVACAEEFENVECTTLEEEEDPVQKQVKEADEEEEKKEKVKPEDSEDQKAEAAEVEGDHTVVVEVEEQAGGEVEDQMPAPPAAATAGEENQKVVRVAKGTGGGKRGKNRNKSLNQNKPLSHQEIQNIREIIEKMARKVEGEENLGNKKYVVNAYDEIEVEEQVPGSPGSIDSGFKESTNTGNRGFTPTTEYRGSTASTGHGGFSFPPLLEHEHTIQNQVYE